jgi:uncharacterized protein (TIGR02118 family)
MSSAPDQAVRTMLALTRQPHLSFEEFDRYWRDVHGPIAAQIPGLTRYVQRHVITSDADSASPLHIDGFAILEYENAGAMAAAWASDQGRLAMEDADRFRQSRIRFDFDDVVYLNKQ